MNFKRIGRILVCLLLVCCLLMNVTIPRAKATGIFETIATVSTVLGPVGTIAAATVIAIGLYAGSQPEEFENLCDTVSTALSDAGAWVVDGMTELLRVEDSEGNATYYVDSGLMENVRSWAYDSDIVYNGLATSHSYAYMGYPCLYADFPFGAAVFFSESFYYVMLYANQAGNVCIDTDFDSSYVPLTSTISSSYGSPYNGIYFSGSCGPLSDWEKVSSNYDGVPRLGTFSENAMSEYQLYNYNNGPFRYVIANCNLSFVSFSDITLGTISSQSTDLTDGTSARAWSEEYTSHALMVNPSGNDGDEYKLYYPVVLPPSVSDFLTQTQADQWTGAASPGFTDYEDEEDYIVLDMPTVDGYQGLVLSPADTATDTDTETDTDSGADTETGVVVLPTWLKEGISNIWNGLLDILSTLLGLPASIASAIWEAFPPWLQEGIHNLVNGLSSILESLAAMPQIIIDGIAGVLTDALTWAFAVSDTFISTKVEALTAKYPYLDTFLALGTDLKSFLTGLGTTPPIIYINLGATNGSYDIGGQEVFMDLSWYAAYKPTMDTVLGGFIWLWLAWRIYLSIPGIISGASGVWGAASRSSERSMRSKGKEEST